MDERGSSGAVFEGVVGGGFGDLCETFTRFFCLLHQFLHSLPLRFVFGTIHKYLERDQKSIYILIIVWWCGEREEEKRRRGENTSRQKIGWQQLTSQHCLGARWQLI